MGGTVECVFLHPLTDYLQIQRLGRSPRPMVRPEISTPLDNNTTVGDNMSQDVEWTTALAICKVQNNFISQVQNRENVRDDLYCTTRSRTWIPDDPTDLQLRLCIIRHWDASEQRSLEAAEDGSRSQFCWTSFSEDVRSFVQTCIHFLSTQSEEKVLSPSGKSLYGTKASDVLQFDFIEVDSSLLGENAYSCSKTTVLGIAGRFHLSKFPLWTRHTHLSTGVHRSQHRSSWCTTGHPISRMKRSGKRLKTSLHLHSRYSIVRGVAARSKDSKRRWSLYSVLCLSSFGRRKKNGATYYRLCKP